MKSQNKNTLWEINSIFGFDWIWGRYLLTELQQLPLDPGACLLDIGCGTQPYRQILQDKVATYYGLDLLRPGVTSDIYGNALRLPLASSSVDACFSVWLLDDLANPQEYFDEVARVLKPGGTAVMVDVQSFPEHDAPFDYHRFTRFALEHYSRTAGLFVHTMHCLGGFWAQMGTQLGSFFLRGVSGYCALPCRLVAPLVNLTFYALDRLNPIARGTFAHFAVFKK